MNAACQTLLFDDLGPRRVQADFSGGWLSSDAGALLLRQVDTNLGLTQSLSLCFGDGRNQLFVEHSVPQLLRQRLFGTALGYEDLNDHERLRLDPLLAVACEKTDPLGEERPPQYQGKALACPATLNRLELSNNKQTRCHKIPHDPAQIEACLLKMGARCLPKNSREVIVDLDAMGHRLHGFQEGRHFNAYYDDYCYLPLYAFAGPYPLLAQLRTADTDAATGVVAALEKMVAAIRRRCPKARIIVRADSGFGREEIMAWCEGQREVYYCLGLAKNSVLIEKLQSSLARARERHCLCGAVSVREFTEFVYQTQHSWSRPRRVIGKAEVMVAGENPRFVVTNLPVGGFKGEADQTRFLPAPLYEGLYCARGDMENLLKQQVLDLKADRMSTEYLASNQLRLWFAMFAYLLLERLRSQGLAGTELEHATAGTLRRKLLKVAAQVRVSVRRVCVQMSSAYPLQALFRLCYQRLRAVPLGFG